MNKFIPKTSAPGPVKFPTKGPHNHNVGTHGSGLAPKPSGGAALPGNDRPSMPAQAGLARVKNVGMGKADMRLPVQNPPANQKGMKIGQKVPNTSAAATKKPNRKGGAAFFGES